MQVGLGGWGWKRSLPENKLYLLAQSKDSFSLYYNPGLAEWVVGVGGCVCVAEELYYYSTLLDDDKMRQEQLKQPAEGGYRVLLVLMGIRFYTRGRFSIHYYYYFGEGNQALA